MASDRAGRHWSEEELGKLRRWTREGKTAKFIAQQLGRSHNAVNQRRCIIGIRVGHRHKTRTLQTYTVAMHPELRERLQQRAGELGTNVSEIVRRAVIEHLERQSPG